MNIRFAEERDIDRIMELEKLCFSDAWSEEMIREDVLENRISSYLVAEEEELPIGYIGYWTIPGECQINNVAIHPDYRGRGIAKNLIDKMLELTREAGVGLWTLEVRVGNEEAINLYKSKGFGVVGRRPNYYEDGEDAFLMDRSE